MFLSHWLAAWMNDSLVNWLTDWLTAWLGGRMSVSAQQVSQQGIKYATGRRWCDDSWRERNRCPDLCFLCHLSRLVCLSLSVSVFRSPIFMFQSVSRFEPIPSLSHLPPMHSLWLSLSHSYYLSLSVPQHHQTLRFKSCNQTDLSL